MILFWNIVIIAAIAIPIVGVLIVGYIAGAEIASGESEENTEA